MSAKIGIIMGSDSDYPHMEKGIKLLKQLKIEFEIEVSSAHRTPDRTIALIKSFEEKGVKVIIAAAGGAAHLPGVIAAHTILPVLGVPITSPLSGIDSLYSIVQMPGGIPVAAFGIGSSGGLNAILFALEILSLSDENLKKEVLKYREEQKLMVKDKSDALKKKISE
jgi:5-(carboxyamino)imidazole ribonucleotide mutase